MLDTFSRTFLPAAVAARIPLATINRHVNVLRGCVGNRDRVLAAVPCGTPNRPLRRGTPNNLLLLTAHRLVVTTESPLLRRLNLYLNADLRHLADVTWSPEPTRSAVLFSATAVDGAREHFWLRLPDADGVARLDGVLRDAFRGAWVVAQPAPPTVGVAPIPAAARLAAA